MVKQSNCFTIDDGFGRRRLGLERASAAAGLHRVGILKREPLFFQTLEPINGGAVKVQGALLVDYDGHSVALVLAIDLIVERFIEIQGVIEPAASAAGDADPQYNVVLEVMFFTKSLDFFSGSFGQFDCHGWINPLVLGESKEWR